MINFRPLSGAASSDDDNATEAPLSYLLTVDGVRILLDCGRKDGDSDEQYVRTLRDVAPTVDLVLLSHGDTRHTGLYAYARARWGLLAPTYATQPVQALSRLAALEHAYHVRTELPPEQHETDEVCVLPVAEINTAWEAVNALRYTQPTHLQGRATGLTITPFNAGHSLGGTLWKIRSPASGTVQYAVGMNHTKERTLDGTALVRNEGGLHIFEPLARPDVLITDAGRTKAITPRRKDRESQLLDMVTSTMEKRCSVLIPVSLDSRLLELLVLLSQHWEFARLRVPLCLVSKHGKEFLASARSLMEWFGGAVGAGVLTSGGVGSNLSSSANTGNKRKRVDDDSSPLRFPSLELFPTPAQLLNTYSSRDPKLILATPACMAYGPSRQIFVEHSFATSEGNLVVLVDDEGGRGIFDGWTGGLAERWRMGQPPDADGGGKTVGKAVKLDGSVAVSLKSKEPLTGTELSNYLAEQAAVKEAAEKANLALQRDAANALVASDSSSDSESDTDDDDNEGDDDDEVNNAIEVERQTLVAEPGGGGVPRSRRARREEMRIYDDLLSFGVDSSSMIGGKGFDTFLKSNNRTQSFFISNPTDKEGRREGRTRPKMFPFYERRRKVDEYGEEVDVGMWIRRGREIEENQASQEAAAAAAANQIQEENEKEEDPPSKFLSTTIDLVLSCSVLYVDMSGLNDGRAVKTILPHVGARKMILVHASRDATSALLDSFSQIRGITKEVSAPREGENLQIGQNTKSFAISLSDELVASLKMSSFEDNEVGFVRGRIATHTSSSIPILEPVLPSLEDPSKVKMALLPKTTLIGDLKLTLLKSRLASLGISAEFAGEGVLLCSDSSALSAASNKAASEANGEVGVDIVSVKKQGADHVFVEAAGPSDVYYKVRKEVYGMHAVVGA